MHVQGTNLYFTILEVSYVIILDVVSRGLRFERFEYKTNENVNHVNWV